MNKKKWLLILDIAALLGMITLISVTGYNTFMIWSGRVYLDVGNAMMGR